MKIGFVTDTNLLKKQEAELFNTRRFLNDTDFFIDYIQSLEKTASKNKLIYFMPEIVIEELYYQKVRAFEIQYETFCKKYNEINYGIDGELPKNNIELILNEEKEKYIDRFKILNLNYNEQLFKELVDEAIKKKPPFDKSKEGKKTDAGYKDALIWKSILYSSSIDECDKFYLFSCDRIFVDNQEELKKEFKINHPTTDLIIKFFEPNGQQRQNSLQSIIVENNLIETEIIKLYNLELILEKIKSIIYNYEEEVYYFMGEENKITLKNINFEKFEKEDFEIKDVKEETEKYKVVVKFSTKKYSCNEELENANKKTLEGKVILNFEKKGKTFELIDYKIRNVEFYSNYFSNLSVNIAKILSGIYSDAMKKTIESFSNAITMSVEPLNKMRETINNITLNLGNNSAFKMLSEGIIEATNELKENSEDKLEETEESEEAKSDKEENKEVE